MFQLWLHLCIAYSQLVSWLTGMHCKYLVLLFLVEDLDDSENNNGVIIALTTLLVIVVIGLVISVVINVFFVVQRKQSRCVVTSIHSVQLQLSTVADTYNVDQQSNVRYSDVKQSVSRDNTIKDSTYVNIAIPSEPEYEAIETDHKPNHDVKVAANPAYHASSQSCKKHNIRETTVATILIFTM